MDIIHEGKTGKYEHMNMWFSLISFTNNALIILSTQNSKCSDKSGDVAE